MDKTYQDQIKKTVAQKAEIKKLFRQLKKRKPKELDQVFHTGHEDAFSHIDCLKCANCCKTTSPIFRDVDIKRISKHLKMSPIDFENEYLKMDDEGDWVLQESPCHFLLDDNTCFIYEVRPQACREYPHTDRKRMVQILDLTEKNVEICPAVAEVVEKVVDHYSN